MKKNIEREIYCAPQIEQIKLDNDISLQLESNPPAGPFEGSNTKSTPDYFNNNPIDLSFA